MQIVTPGPRAESIIRVRSVGGNGWTLGCRDSSAPAKRTGRTERAARPDAQKAARKRKSGRSGRNDDFGEGAEGSRSERGQGVRREEAAKMEVGVGAPGVAERGGGCHDLSDPSARRDVLLRSMCRPSAQVIAGGLVR